MADAAGSGVGDRILRRPRLFFGWWVVVAGAGIQFLTSALMNQAYGTYVVLLREDFGWSKTALSAASSLREAESGIISPVQGFLLDRLGPRNVTRAGIVILAIGFALFSRIDSLTQFYGAFFMMAIGASLCGYVSITFAAVHWFERRRSTAIGLTSTGFALGGMAVVLTVQALEHLGWRDTALLSAGIILAAGLPLAQLIRIDLDRMGLAPDGDPIEEHRSRTAANASGVVETDFTLGEALRTASFWWIGLGHAFSLFIVSAMGVHLVSHLNEGLGYSLGGASGIVFLMTVMQFFGNITGGPIGDRFSKRWLCVVCMGMHAGGLLLLSHASGLAMVVGFAALHGLAWGWRGPQMAAIRADYFGRSAFGKILGVSNLVIILGTILGPLIAGFVYDRTGNYQVGFDILSVLAALGTVFFVLAKRPPPPARLALR